MQTKEHNPIVYALANFLHGAETLWGKEGSLAAIAAAKAFLECHGFEVRQKAYKYNGKCVCDSIMHTDDFTVLELWEEDHAACGGN